MGRDPNRLEPTEVGSRTGTIPDARQAFINRSIGMGFLDMEKHLGWHGGYLLEAVSVKKNEDGWLCMVKAKRNGSQWVAYVNASSFPESLELAAEFAERGILTWHKDKWPRKKR